MQTVLVWIIVVAAALYIGRKYYRTLSGKDRGCDCGADCGCDSCSQANDGKLCNFPPKDEQQTKER